jgi:hypothetical protein
MMDRWDEELQVIQTEVNDGKMERVILIAMLTKAFPSMIAYRSPDETGMDDGRDNYGWVVYIQLPTGQVSFHVGPDTRATWFDHLIVAPVNPWDRHTQDTKMKRIVEYIDGDVR